MNLLKNVNYFFGGNTHNQVGKAGNLLFSGVLATLLGTTSLQVGIMNPIQDEPRKETKAGQERCQEQSGVKAIIADSSLGEVRNKERLQKDDIPEECHKQQQVEEVLKAEVAMGGAVPLQAEALDHQTQEARKKEEQYQKRVSELETMLKGYPLAKMAPEIAKQDPEIAALLVGIARKESQWGLRSPKKNGDCFNYWGLKGAGSRGVGMGHACFGSREEAIQKVSKRLEQLVQKRGTSKPSALVVTWKCGRSCATHSPESVRKWVSDVNQYYTKVLAMK